MEHYLEPMLLLKMSLTKEEVEFDKFLTVDIGGSVDAESDETGKMAS